MNIAIIGYGKMGREIESILVGRGHKVTFVVDEYNARELTADNLRQHGVDVAIEFTSPRTAYTNITTCLEAGVAVVCGTTGWLDRYGDVVALCEKTGGAFFYASNYSVGVNIFFRINRMLARIMDAFPDYDVTVEEVHHTQKKDAPSGTAITIAESIVDNLGRKESWVANTTTEPHELEVSAIRRSVVPGTHTVTYESEADRIVIMHEAKNRKGLAVGAVMAAEFLEGRKGVYSMDDLLDI